MAKTIGSAHDWTLRHLAGILRGYLEGEKWCTEKRLESEIRINHSIEELQEVLNSSIFAYLLRINPERLHQVRTKFLEV